MEGDEDFTVTINSSSLPYGVFIGDHGEATVTIKDDDGKLTIILCKFFFMKHHTYRILLVNSCGYYKFWVEIGAATNQDFYIKIA